MNRQETVKGQKYIKKKKDTNPSRQTSVLPFIAVLFPAAEILCCFTNTLFVFRAKWVYLEMQPFS